MPLQYIKAKKGWRYGSTGKLYRGKNAREHAREQGRAIELSKLRKEGRLVEREGKVITVKATKRARGYVREV